MEWGEKIPFKIDDDMIVVDDLAEFTASLDRHFSSWNKNEFSKDGKLGEDTNRAAETLEVKTIPKPVQKPIAKTISRTNVKPKPVPALPPEITSKPTKPTVIPEPIQRRIESSVPGHSGHPPYATSTSQNLVSNPLLEQEERSKKTKRYLGIIYILFFATSISISLIVWNLVGALIVVIINIVVGVLVLIGMGEMDKRIKLAQSKV